MAHTGSETEIELPASLGHAGAEVDSYALRYFAFTYADITAVVIPDAVKDLGECTFYGCENLESVVLPGSITVIPFQAFALCTSLTSLTLPDSVESIEDYSLWRSGLKELRIEGTITGFGENWNGEVRLDTL